MEFLRVPYSVLLFFAFTFWFLACFFDVFVSLFPSMMMTYKLYHLLPPPSSFLDTVGIIIFDRSLLKITLRLRVSHRGLFFITLDNFVPIYLEPTLKCLFVVLLLLSLMKFSFRQASSLHSLPPAACTKLWCSSSTHIVEVNVLT